MNESGGSVGSVLGKEMRGREVSGSTDRERTGMWKRM